LILSESYFHTPKVIWLEISGFIMSRMVGYGRDLITMINPRMKKLSFSNIRMQKVTEPGSIIKMTELSMYIPMINGGIVLLNQ
jgi:hypothetical protein